jgi:hypothetical protein
MRRILFLITALSFVSTVVWAKTDEEIEEAISFALSQRHPREGQAWWRDLGPGAPRVIIKMYQATTNTYQHMRLIQGLGWFNDSAGVDFIKQQAQSSLEGPVRNAAIRTISITQGVNEIVTGGRPVVEVLKSLMTKPPLADVSRELFQ